MDNAQQLGIPRKHHPAVVVGLQVKQGDRVAKQAPVLVYEYKANLNTSSSESPDYEVVRAMGKKVAADGTFAKREYLRSPFEGEISGIMCRVGDSVTHGQPLVEVTMSCAHGTVFNGLCALCGKDVSNIDLSGIPDTQANIDMFHESKGLKVSSDVAMTIGESSRDALWQQRKLSLIIDLDQTIIHANASLDPGFESWLIDNYKGPGSPSPMREGDETDGARQSPAERHLPSDIGAFYLSDSVHRYFIKLRPGLHEFLENLSRLYEMHIYTLGSRPYADAVTAIIDPDGRYFNHRVLSYGETNSWTKSLSRLFPVDTSMVAIIDDRADVWGWPPNLIKVHRYEFFRSIGDINAANLPPQSPLDEKSDDDIPIVGNGKGEDTSRQETASPSQSLFLGTDDRELYMLQGLLSRMHTGYYEALDASGTEHPPDLADILTAEKKSVLSGVTIVFSAAFPINPGSPPPHCTELWHRALMFGARCELEITDRTTHVVAGKPETEKVHAARKRGRAATGAVPPIVVKIQWLLESIRRWQKLDEEEFLWYSEDKDVVARIRKAATGRMGPGRSGLSSTTRKRLMGQEPTRGSDNYESANTTDIEDELERQEAGLEEHEAEVDSFMQNLDWDDLEREAMEDSESEDGSDSARTPSAGASRAGSRATSSTDLRHVAMRQAAKQRIPHGGATGDPAELGDDAQADSSDAFAECSSSSSSSSEEEGTARHRMKRRKTSPETSDRHKANSKRLSQLSIDDGRVDLGTASESSVDDGGGTTPKRDHSTTRSRLARAAGVAPEPEPSILGKRSKRGARRSSGQNDAFNGSSGDEYNEDGDRNVDAPLFAGIEDRDAVIDSVERDDDNDNDYDGGSGEEHQWGEDDDSDEGNFDDLINTLEEEISSP